MTKMLVTLAAKLVSVRRAQACDPFANCGPTPQCFPDHLIGCCPFECVCC